LGPPFDQASKIKTEFTMIEIDCRNREGQRRLVRLLAWPFGIRKVLSDEAYPDTPDEEMPFMNLMIRVGGRPSSRSRLDPIGYFHSAFEESQS
jgi:hypothetical protein